MENAHLLIVDDDCELSAMLCTYFQEQGYRVSVLDRGDALDAALARYAPDLLILEIGRAHV